MMEKLIFNLIFVNLDFAFELDTSLIIGGNPIIDDDGNVIYNLRWTYTPLDPS